MLAQTVVAPWTAQLRVRQDGTAGRSDPDDRPVAAIAAELARATPGQDEGDGNAPPDVDEHLRGFVQAIAATATATATARANATAREGHGGWLAGVRQYIRSAGPVPNSRFI